jgi:hypothetical protein
MIFNFIITIIVKAFAIVYRWLDQYLIAYLLNFVKGFEFAIIIMSMILFLVISVFLTIRHLKRLPKYYVIEIVDAYGKKTTIDDLRIIFVTYDAAESYVRFYRDTYKEQYKFRVIGLKDKRIVSENKRN